MPEIISTTDVLVEYAPLVKPEKNDSLLLLEFCLENFPVGDENIFISEMVKLYPELKDHALISNK
eukprot:56799-Eustigmatos_ZCMA.PRE.2